MRQESFSLFRIIFAALLVPVTLFSQNSLRGKVTDVKTKEGVPFASVYLANTTIGVATLEDGSFEIRNISNGTYEIAVSAVGFKSFHRPFQFQSNDYNLDIALKQDSVMLSEIVVRASESDSRKYLPLFQKLFLGQTGNSIHCTIVNPEVINFHYDRSSKILTANSSGPIVVNNKALGYRNYYDLDIFQYDNKSEIKMLSGKQRLEDLSVENSRERVKYDKKRSTAYFGSVRHFMQALYNGRVKQEGFLVSIADSTMINNFSNRSGAEEDISKHLTGTIARKFSFKGILRVEYLKENEDWFYKRSRFASPTQVSYLIFKNDAITIYENGYFVDQLSVYLLGYLAWAEVISETVSADFIPKRK